MAATGQASDSAPGELAEAGTGQPAAPAGRRSALPSPAVTAIIAATVLGLGLRVFLLTRPGLLVSGTVEYDDGVYLGAALRFVHGALPYRDFAFVQPPGILIVSLPAALAATVASPAAGLAAARVLTVCASAACVPLAGNLVRHRGVLVTTVTCGLLAVYPADVLAARTLLLEPWMNLCCLLAANAAFSRGRLASPRRLGWAGAALGFAVAIKFWAAVPAAALLVTCLAVRPSAWTRIRTRRVRAYLLALGCGFVLPVAPFASGAPVAFVHATLLDQITRIGSYTPLSLRLAHLTGLIDVLNRDGKLTATAQAHSLFAVGSNATTAIVSAGWLPFAVALLAAGGLGAGYFRRPGERSHLEWFALGTAAVSSAAILGYSAFFYHYPDFPAPWIAIAAGGAVGAVTGGARDTAGGASETGAATAAARRAAQRFVIGGTALVILALAAFQARELAAVRVPASPPAASVIPAGACLVTDQVSLAIAADRFTPSRPGGPGGPGCPDILDSLATTLVLSGGVSPQGGAALRPHVVSGWEAILGQARYVWLSGGYRQRIPWTAGLQAWFTARFRLVATFPGYARSRLYVRAG